MNRLKLMALAAAAIASMSGAPTSRLPHFTPLAQNFGWGGKRRRRGQSWNTKNQTAREYGVPKAFRQYARRYGSDIHALAQTHRQNPAPMLDHGRDRRKVKARVLATLKASEAFSFPDCGEVKVIHA